MAFLGVITFTLTETMRIQMGSVVLFVGLLIYTD